MTSDEDPILAASLSTFSRYGIRRTAMADIAKAAGISRQTLYSRYRNKEVLIAATVEYVQARSLKHIENCWEQVQSMEDVLRCYFEHATLAPFRIMQSLPDASELLDTTNECAAEVFNETRKRKVEMLATQLGGHEAQLASSGESAQSIAAFIVTCSDSLKYVAENEAILQQRLNSLQKMVLSLLK